MVLVLHRPHLRFGISATTSGYMNQQPRKAPLQVPPAAQKGAIAPRFGPPFSSGKTPRASSTAAGDDDAPWPPVGAPCVRSRSGSSRARVGWKAKARHQNVASSKARARGGFPIWDNSTNTQAARPRARHASRSLAPSTQQSLPLPGCNAIFSSPSPPPGASIIRTYRSDSPIYTYRHARVVAKYTRSTRHQQQVFSLGVPTEKCWCSSPSGFVTNARGADDGGDAGGDPRRPRRTARSSSQVAVALVALSVICGLVAFILCLAAEGSRSEARRRPMALTARFRSLQVSYYLMSVDGSQNQLDVCFYNSSGRTALAYAVGAFILLAVAMFAEHAYMLVAVAAPESASAGLAVAHENPRVASTAATLTWQTCCLFFLTWYGNTLAAPSDQIKLLVERNDARRTVELKRTARICFGLAEVLLMIGIGVESGHMSDWKKPRPVCHRVRPGMFAAAGILGLITVVVGFVVYVTAVQAQRLRGQPHAPHYGGGGGHFVGHGGAPYPGVQHQHLHPHPAPHPHPHPHPAPSAPEITAAHCQVQPSGASIVTKEVAEV
ncbi:hypothetical protein HU200_021085 [Digitaria exilis]|uniref:Uncharacterized protein n=1 Tax=Digitaria exilis TaxID=1010633 RepID=A0A835KBG6_9POAL|nr:hypothetical protein HU200_021085 [Digitaria exilis]